MSMIHNMYNTSLPYAQKLMINLYDKIPFPYRYGPIFAKHYKWLMKTQWFTAEELEDLQNERLREIIQHAYKNVPYYKRIFKERDIEPSDIKTKEDLQLLPILTKEDIRENFKELTAKNYSQFQPSLRHTSGSTGEPLSYYIDKNLALLTEAVVWRHWNWCGLHPKENVAVFRGTLIDEFGDKQKQYYKKSNNQIHFSTFNMNDKIMTSYIQAINENKPSMIRGYPASLEILARHITNNHMHIHKPKAIHTSSEIVLPHQRKLIEEAFNAPLFDWYGHGESTVCAGECECHNGLHLNMEYGCTEFIKTTESKDIKNVYNIISTSLWNYSMPLIRYDTEDLALIENALCDCGRRLPIINKIIGRSADIIKGTNGVQLSPSSFVHFWKYRIAEHLVDIKYAQIVQENDPHIRIILVGKKNAINENLIKSELIILLGDIEIEFDYLDEIPTGEKWRFTVSKKERHK